MWSYRAFPNQRVGEYAKQLCWLTYYFLHSFLCYVGYISQVKLQLYTECLGVWTMATTDKTVYSNLHLETSIWADDPLLSIFCIICFFLALIKHLDIVFIWSRLGDHSWLQHHFLHKPNKLLYIENMCLLVYVNHWNT